MSGEPEVAGGVPDIGPRVSLLGLGLGPEPGLGRTSPVAVAVPTEGVEADGGAEVTVVWAGTPEPVVDRHLRGDVAGSRPWLADVLLGRGTSLADAVELARTYPGALVVGAYAGPYCWLRVGAGPGHGAGLLMRGRVMRGYGPESPWPVLASVVHAWRVAWVCPQGLAPATATVSLPGLHGAVSLRRVSLQPVV